jgi:putative methanogen marker protein 4
MVQDILGKLSNVAAQSKRRVGIGVRNETPELLHAVETARAFSEVVLVGNVKNANGDVVRTPEPEQKLVELLVNGTVDAAVRGTMSARETLKQLKRQTGARKMCRSALLSTAGGRQFFLLPVGIDEGKSTRDRTHLIEKTAHLLNTLGVIPKVGVLSGGRSEDRGRTKAVDLTLKSAQALTKQLQEAGIDATNYNILIEDAVKSSNILAAPDGVVGNLIFRTLVFLGDGKGHGAPFFGIQYTFVDTSRSAAAFADAILVARALSNLAHAVKTRGS